MLSTTENLSSDAGRRPPLPSRETANPAPLEVLDCLTPPSPSSSIDYVDISSLCSYGEIPILLDPSIVLHLPETTETEDPALLRVTSYASPDSIKDEFILADRLLEPVYGGQRATVPRGAHDELDTLAIPSESYYSFSQYVASQSNCGDYGIDSTPVYSTSPAISSVATFIGSAGGFPVGSPSLASFGVSPSCSVASQQFLTEDLRSSALCGRLPGFPRSRSTNSTGTLGSSHGISPSSSRVGYDTLAPYASPPSSNLQIRRLQKSRSCFPLTLRDISSGQIMESQSPRSEPTTPFLATSGPPLIPRQHRRTESNATSASSRSVRSSHISSPLASPAAKRRLTRNLPGVLDWLEDTRIDLWIDQEGSHVVRQTFKLAGFTTGCPEEQDTALVSALTYGLAEFMPMMRRSFVFDAGRSDVPPTLRRVTIAEDDTKDYISYQATLATSSDGAYAVSGTEYFKLHRNQAPLALRWRFEYFVQVGPRETEKTLTPLRFSSSPGLLHPSHGRKQTKLLQIFKRSSSTRLFAEKMEVPRQSYGLHDRRNASIGSEKENYGHGLGLNVAPGGGERRSPDLAESDSHEPVRQQLDIKLKRSPRLTPTMLRPTTPTQLMSLHAEFLRTRGNGGCNDWVAL